MSVRACVCVPACHAAWGVCVCVGVRELERVRVRVCVCAVCPRACTTTTASTTTTTAAKTATTTTTKIDGTESWAGGRLPLSSTTRQGASWGVTVLFQPQKQICRNNRTQHTCATTARVNNTNITENSAHQRSQNMYLEFGMRVLRTPTA